MNKKNTITVFHLAGSVIASINAGIHFFYGATNNGVLWTCIAIVWLCTLYLRLHYRENQ